MRMIAVATILFLLLDGCTKIESNLVEPTPDVVPSNFDKSRMADCRLRWEVRLENPLRDETVYERPKPVTELSHPLSGDIQVFAYPEEETVVEESCQGMKVRVANSSNEAVAIPTIDFWLYLIQEARDAEGNWRPIEYRDSPFCDYSNFSIELPAHQYWEFDVPRYEGEMETELRFALGLDEGQWIYSEPFRGSINSGQFTSNYSSEKQRSNPKSIFVMPSTELE